MTFTPHSVARKLKFHQLAVFVQVLQSGSLLHAAQVMSLTQPAVTKIIHELESYFDAPLLVRSNRGVTATELGELIRRRAQSMLSELRALTDEVNAHQQGTSGQVRVGTLISASTSLLPRAMQLLKQRAPGVLVSLRTGQMSHLFPALASGELDLVVSRVPDDWRWRDQSSDLAVEVLYEEELRIVAGAQHPLHGQAPASLAELHRYPWVLPTRDSLLRLTANRLFAEAGLSTPDNVVESLSILTNITLMQDQQTIALMPEEASQQFVDAGLLRAFELGTSLKFGDIGCFYSNSHALGPAAQLFRECLSLASGPAGERPGA